MSKFAELLNNVYGYESEDKFEAALGVIPMDELMEAAATEPQDGELGAGYSEEDRFIIHMLKWFKGWFSWVNAPECGNCKSSEHMKLVGRANPNEEEDRYGAKMVELWQCTVCHQSTRFPRYNDCVRLLSYRKGRCGEWCNVMHLLLRSLGRDTRYVWNSEDHVWNEIWSEDKQRWIHVDSCEAAFDNPQLYTDGWGKKMAYVIGFSVFGATDITRRYVRRPEMAIPRSIAREEDLDRVLKNLSAVARQKLDPVEEVNAYMRDQKEAAELASYVLSTKTGADMLPRQSGSQEWTQQRGEAGS